MQSRTDAVMALVRREIERRPWIENEHHLGTVTLLIRFDRSGQPSRCIVRTEGECDV
jgi:hypothetical protein